MSESAPTDAPSSAPAEGAAPFPVRTPVAGGGSETIKSTLISLLIAFSLTLVVRAFVVEAFIIPTGSMAPTLNGRHMRFHSPQTGFDWAVNPWRGRRGDGAEEAFVDAMDPSSRLRLEMPNNDIVAGDRILVLKFLGSIFPPSRWDVVVFKNPEHPSENYIKRLVGLPNEEVWIADGDIFVREPGAHDESRAAWRIERKPERVQRALWWTLFSTEMTPLDAEHSGVYWRGPWTPEDPSRWTIDGPSMRVEGDAPAELAWDNDRWPIDDWIPYNDAPDIRLRAPRFPVSDLRLRAVARPEGPGLRATASLLALGHEFRATIDSDTARIEMRTVAGGGGDRDWRTLAEAPFTGLSPGRATSLEFRHVDQALSVWIDGERVAYAEYDWGPWERLRFALGQDEAGLERELRRARGNALAEGDLYQSPRVSWRFEGSPATLTRVGLDRDLYYEASEYLGSALPLSPALATHPANLPALGPDQYFVLGDNSASSKDGRLWDTVDPWVRAEIDETMGVVPGKLLMGKAFFVYFPAPHEVRIGSGLHRIVPDFGRMRLIR